MRRDPSDLRGSSSVSKSRVTVSDGTRRGPLPVPRPVRERGVGTSEEIPDYRSSMEEGRRSFPALLVNLLLFLS